MKDRENELRQKELRDLWNSIKHARPDTDNLPYFIYFAYLLADEEIERDARQALQSHPLGKKIYSQFLRGVDANIFLRALNVKLKIDISQIIELIFRHGHFLYDEQFWFKFASHLSIPLTATPSVFDLSSISIDLSLEEKLNRYTQFKNFHKLDVLSIYSYARHLFPEPALVLPKIQKILVGGRLKRITADVKFIQTSSLQLIFMKLKKIPAELFESSVVTELKVIDNLLDHLPELKQSNCHLNELDLTHNKLAALPNTFHKLTNLQRLTLAKNNFQNLDTFRGLGKLRFLNLTENKLTRLNMQSGELPALEELNCYSNNISEIGDEITELKKLKLLDLRFNPIDVKRIAWLRETMPNTKVLHY